MRLHAPTLMTALIGLAGFMIGTSFAPWWLRTVLGVVNLVLLFALRWTLRDHLLAVALGFDAGIRESERPKVLVVSREGS